MKKTIILPFLLVLAFIVKISFGIEIPEELLNGLADVLVEFVLVIGAILGVVKAYKQKKEGGE